MEKQRCSGRSYLILALWIAGVSSVSNRAAAHGGFPATAEMRYAPARCVVVDQSVTIPWRDSNTETLFGPATVEIYTTTVASRPLYTNEIPFVPNKRIHAVSEVDTRDSFTWRTATVAEGHYFVYSYVREPPEELSPLLVRYAPYVVTVQHGATPVGPTVVVTRPDIFAGSLGNAQIHYSACDPSGTARVRIEVAPEPGDGEYRVIFDDLPAVPTATVVWDTRAFREGRWVVRAKIADQCGHVFESYARGFLEVRVPVDPFDAGTGDAVVAEPIDARTGGGAACNGLPDATPMDAASAAPDAGFVGRDRAIDVIVPDAGEGGTGEGCSCEAASPSSAPGAAWLIAPLVVLALRLRRRAATAGLAAVLAVGPVAPARAQEVPADLTRPPSGEVLTYYGLRKLEFDASVSDEEKAREWEAFLKRNAEQVAYAKQAIVRWRDAGRLRAVEAAEQLDQMAEAPAADKIDAWQKVAKQFPKTPDARTAEKRIAHWRTTESKRLAQIAGEVEKSRATKVERINAWRTVLDFAVSGPEKKNAEKRIALLQAQLVKEAEDLDRIPRVDVETKLSAWRDVLAGMPNAAQKRTAEQRIAYLQSKGAR